jgi:hypothetical protein
MATQQSRISDGFAAVRDKLNLITPRLVPPGGALGQVLTKASGANYSFEWVTPATGGSGGGGSSSRFRGTFGSNYTNKIVTFADGIPADWVFSNPPVIVDDADNESGTTKALSFATVNPNYGSQNATFQTKADASFNQLVIRYKVETEFNYDFFKVYVDNVEAYSDSGINAYKTATISLSPGPHTIKLEVFCDGEATAGFNNVHFSRHSIPVEVASEPYAYGDTVTYNGQTWFNTVAGTTQTPGSGTDWRALGGVTYTAGNGVTISGSNEVAIDDTKVARKDIAQTLTGNQTITGTLSVSSTLTASNLSGTNTGDQTTITGNAGSATKLATARTLAITGDLTWTSPAFDGTGNVTAAGTLATVNSNTGSFGSMALVPVITVDGKGRITAVSTANIATVYAPLASPTFTGTPAAPTPAVGNNSTQIATTAYVQSTIPAVASYAQPYQNQQFYTTPGARGTMTLNADTIYLVPMSTHSTMNLYNIGVNVTTAGTGNARFGIYTLSQSVNGRNFSVYSVAPNVVSLNGTGVRSGGYSQIQSLPPGKYFMAIQCSSTVTVTSLVATEGLFADTIGAPAAFAFSDGFAGFSYGWSYGGGMIGGSGFNPIQATPLIGIKSF